MIKYTFALILTAYLLILPGCSQKQPSLRVAASSVPHAEMLEFLKPDLKAEGIDLEIIVTDDYNLPNQALANKEVDANFFQHTPFLQAQIEQFHYPIQSIAKIQIEPMGIYSKKVRSLSELKDRAIVALPNDPTNEARALMLLQKQDLIELDDPNNLHATEMNISQNPKKLKFLEIDAAMLPRTLEDADIAVVNTNYALAAGLSPLTDALVLEHSDSPYSNILVIRKGDEYRLEILALKALLTSEKMKNFILSRYQGAVLPAFD